MRPWQDDARASRDPGCLFLVRGKGLSPPSTLGTGGEGCNISFLKVSAPVFDTCTDAISDGDAPGIQTRLGVEKWSPANGAWSRARARATFKCQYSGVCNGTSPVSSTAQSSLSVSRRDYLSPADRRRFLILFIHFPSVLSRPLMLPSTQDPWSARSSGRSSPSTTATASEGQYSGDADDELTTSEEMSGVAGSGSQGLRPGSPTRSDAASVYSYSSSMHHLTRDIYGRTFNNVNDVSTKQPSTLNQS